jgi:hypothetical protein
MKKQASKKTYYGASVAFYTYEAVKTSIIIKKFWEKPQNTVCSLSDMCLCVDWFESRKEAEAHCKGMAA